MKLLMLMEVEGDGVRTIHYIALAITALLLL